MRRTITAQHAFGMLICSFIFAGQAGYADSEIKGSWQIEANSDISSGIAHDGSSSQSEAPQDSSSNISTDLPYKYFGNNFSGKFHRPWCPYSQAMNYRHVVAFHFRWQAIEGGFTPCNFCLPQQWKSVHCVLLKR